MLYAYYDPNFHPCALQTYIYIPQADNNSWLLLVLGADSLSFNIGMQGIPPSITYQHRLTMLPTGVGPIETTVTKDHFKMY